MRQIWTGCILLSTALSSSAVTLGRHSGATILGQALDVRVQVLLAPGEDLANLCLSADVLYGDVQLSRHLVRLTPLKSAPDAQASLRVQSSQAINEPFVTLFVRAGCDTAFTRRYVLLADPLSEPLPAAAPGARAAAPTVQVPALPGVVPSPASTPVPSAPDASRTRESASTAAPARAGARPVPRDPQVAAVAPGTPRAPSVVRRPPKPAPAPATPRLKLDPIDLSAERDPTLTLSPSLLSEPTGSDEARAAAGRLWKAMTATPENVQEDAARLAALEAETAQLRSAQAQAQVRVNELSVQLEQAQDQRYRNWLVYLLGGLLLLALLALLMVSRRRHVQGEDTDPSRAWWSSADGEKQSKAGKASRVAAAPGHPDAGGSRKGQVPVPDRRATHQLDLDQDSSLDSLPGADEVDMPETVRAGVPAPAEQARERRDFSPSALGISRSVAAEELFDVQQQADFFVSLGEEDRAIQVLRNHLAESHEPSPLAYLDLFKLYHRMGRREEYDALRDEFNHVFNAGAPPFNRYTAEGQGLEAYETAFSRIQSLWPEPRVLDLIERSIFRDANDDQVEVFDLEAYRELLLLHAIAKDLIQRDGYVRDDAGDFTHTNMRPLKAAGRVRDEVRDGTGTRNTEPMPLDRAQPVSSRVGLDIDLTELDALGGQDAASELAAFEASLPEVEAPVTPATARTRGAAPREERHLMDFEIVDFAVPEEPSDPPDAQGRDPSRKGRF